MKIKDDEDAGHGKKKMPREIRRFVYFKKSFASLKPGGDL
jgi:hypothetical protein